MIDVKQSFRKGSVIVVVHVEHDEQGNADPIITRDVTDYKSVNKAKKANRVTQYRTVPTDERKKLNGVWVRS